MLFNSYAFIFLFLPATLLFFFIFARYSHQAALAVLLLASIVFYGWYDYRPIFFFIFSIVVNFKVSAYIIGSNSLENRQRCLWVGLVFNLAMLGYFKYSDFFIHNINLMTHSNLKLFHMVMPIGISFFTFTQIAFLVDAYRGLVKKCTLLNYALFVSYFPHLIAGPIIHHKDVMPQFKKARTFKLNYRNIILGLTVFSIGLFKKSVLADYLSASVGPIFDASGQYVSFIDAWTAALSYTLELYFDFSGYSDMAIGLSLLFSVRLPVNFYSPYKAVNIIEFWRRWNITLSRFLRDYLYIPLGGNRKGPIRRYANLLFTMVLGGLWHGASWTFVMWGCLHGIYLCINHGWIALKNKMGIGSNSGFILKTLSRLTTFVAVVVAWVFFRSPDFSTAYKILNAMFFESLVLPTYWHIPASMKALLQKMHVSFTPELTWASHYAVTLIICSLLIVWLLPNSYQFLRKYKPALLLRDEHLVIRSRALLWKPTLFWNCIMALIFVVGIINIQASSIFLYFRF